MKIIKSLLSDEIGSSESLAVTIGNFDGVHSGHQMMIKNLREKCEKSNLKLVIITFIPHPQKILKPDLTAFLIMSYAQRRRYLEEANVDYLIELTFDRDFSTNSAETFLNSHVFNSKKVKALYLGHDFSFGANKEGSFHLALDLGKLNNIIVERQDKFELNGQRFSSSEVRSFIQRGDMEMAQKYLSRPFKLEGLVVKGEGRGRKLGFPTANLLVEEDLLIPQRGVYFTETERDGEVFHSITNVGLNPTVESRDKLSVETHLLNFSEYIYGEKILVRFIKKIRDEKKFASLQELVSQVESDIHDAKKFFSI